MKGLSAATGGPISGDAHLEQSVADILTTPIGTRTMRRDYGSRMLALLAAPLNPATRLQLLAAVAGALLRWEPRIRLSRVGFAAGDRPGAVVITLEGERTDRPAPLARMRLSVPVSLAAATTAA